jgi:DNA helicase HerA-like ATPase
MSLSPLGTLTTVRARSGKNRFELSRGVVAFPSVGDQVLMPTSEQVAAIVGAKDSDRRVKIGVSPMAANAAIMVDPDKIFGRHLAVLGNTGSGKSCSVAGLIRWSLQAAIQALQPGTAQPNMRFVILDPNGEYAKAFADMPDRVRVFRPGGDKNPFVLPAWMWNSHEWSAVTHAQPGAQRPMLMQALRNLRAGRVTREPVQVKVVRQIRLYLSKIMLFLADNTGASFTGMPGKMNAGQTIANLASVIGAMQERAAEVSQKNALGALVDAANTLHQQRSILGKNGTNYFNDFTVLDFEPFEALFATALATFPQVAMEDIASEDAPIPFDVGLLADMVDDLSADGTSNANTANFISYLTLRIRSLMADRRLGSVIDPNTDVTLDGWLADYLGDNASTNGQVAIIDLSLVPSEVTHMLIGVLGRIVFEALQRYRKQQPGGLSLPTVLVLEEAHTFVRRGKDEESAQNSPAQLCREAFERIAREGRKFGLGLVLSSQRPSELSPTVLAQCNTFLLHRLVNDSDQNLVARLVPDNVGGLLRELPSLPSRQAILLGWATPIPILVEMDELANEHRPQSDDPDFWNVWTGKTERAIDWSSIGQDWAGHPVDPFDDLGGSVVRL